MIKIFNDILKIVFYFIDTYRQTFITLKSASTDVLGTEFEEGFQLGEFESGAVYTS